MRLPVQRVFHVYLLSGVLPVAVPDIEPIDRKGGSLKEGLDMFPVVMHDGGGHDIPGHALQQAEGEAESA